MSAAASGVKPAVPSAPVITIISSDGESFSLSADSVAHSHLLDGALRRWAEVYQAKAAQPSSTRNNKGSGDEHGGDHAERRSGSLPNDDDATNTDITVDDPEETPDERFIERYYDETASDVTATSGALEESAEGLDGVAGGGGAGGGAEAVSQDADRPHVMRMVSVPVNDEDDNDDEGEEKNALATNAALGDAPADLLNPNNESDTDSDRTASVLPSSHEGSLSNSNTPTKLSNHSDTQTSAAAVGSGGGMGAAPRSISPFVSDGAASAPTKAPFSPSSRNGSLSDAAASLSGGPKGGQPLRSPASAVRSPISRGSHQSPSTLLDADQSTPSVLSDEEAEEEGARPARSADPRNLGDEGLEDKEEEGEEGSNDTDNADVAARATAERSSPSPLPEATVSSTARYTDPNTAASAPVEKKPLSSPSSPLRSRLSDRRRSATVVQADAAEDDSDDVISAAAGGRGREDCSDPLTELGAAPSGTRAAAASTAAAAQASLPAAAFLLRGSSHTPGSARSGSGGAVNGFAGASPSSCHQRTPCIADEDDVGAMVGEESDDDDDEPVPTPAQATGGAGGGDAAAESYSWSNGARATAGGSSGSARGAAVATTTATTTTTAAAAALPSAQLEEEEEEEEGAVALADLDSSLVYCDAIRITSGAIVVDLAHAGSPHTAPTTPSQSPQSLREAPASPAAAAHELISPASPASGADGAVTATPSACLAPLPSPAATATTDGGKQGSEASTAVSGAKVNIHSSILTLCIRYMTHFAESEAEAARHRDGRRKRHHRRHRRRGSTGSATPATSSDVDDDEEEERDSSSKTSSGSGSGSSTDSSTNTSDSDTDSDDDDDASTVSHSSISPPPLLSAGSSGGGGNNAGGGSLRGGAVAGSGEAGALPGNAPPPGGPALLPLPLSAPLIKYLSPWERTFLYTDVLGCSASVLTAALAIEEVCPEFDYVCPGPWLSKPRVRAALMTPPPPPEGVHTLMEVLAAAKQLQLDPLHALCAGWLADFVIRVSYGATDNFEAAHLIRQCLRVPSDWSRRETDCLKLENEWPANEDAE